MRGSDGLRMLYVPRRRDGTARRRGRADRSSHGFGELWLGSGAQFVGHGEVVFAAGWHAEVGGGVVDSAGCGEEAGWDGGAGPGRAVQASANARIQTDRIAGALQGACGKRT